MKGKAALSSVVRNAVKLTSPTLPAHTVRTLNDQFSCFNCMKLHKHLEYIREVLLVIKLGKHAHKFYTYMNRELAACSVVLPNTLNSFHSHHFKGLQHLIDILQVMTAPYHSLQTVLPPLEEHVVFSHTPV